MNASDYGTRFVVAALATWRLTHLLAHEDGPADIIAGARERLGAGLAGKLMDCFHCLSLWIAIPAAFSVTRRPPEALAAWLALSGAACLLERTGRHPIQMETLQSGKEEIYGMLRTETGGDQESSGLSGTRVGQPGDQAPLPEI